MAFANTVQVKFVNIEYKMAKEFFYSSLSDGFCFKCSFSLISEYKMKLDGIVGLFYEINQKMFEEKKIVVNWSSH